MWRDEKYIKLGFYAYQKFYLKSYRKTKTYEDFMDSKFFTSFTKFGKHILEIGAIDPEGFIDFVLKSNIKLTDWCEDYVYQTWIQELLKNESPDRSIERTFQLMKKWSDDKDEDWTDFFKKVNPILATNWIQSGKISPWLLYSGFGEALFNRMSDEQLLMVAKVIDPKFWSKKLLLNKKEVDHFRTILTEVGL